MAAKQHLEKIWRLRLTVALKYAVRSYIHFLGACINGKYASEPSLVKEACCRYCVGGDCKAFSVEDDGESRKLAETSGAQLKSGSPLPFL